MSDPGFLLETSPAARETWLGLVDRVLKGAPFEKALVSRSYDGIRIEPLFPVSDAPPDAGRAAMPWHIAQRVDHPDAAEANALALADLDGGADALTLVFADAPTSRGFGLEATDADALDRALSGVMLDLIGIRIEAGMRGREAARTVLDLARRRGHDAATLDIELGLDPIGALASGGAMSAPWEVVGARLRGMLHETGAHGVRGRLVLADGRPYHEAGASEAQELACVLATALAYLRALEAGGVPLDTARDALSFLLVADADQFLSVAKLRAFRRLWTRVEAACGLDPRPTRLHAETAWRMTTRRDPWVNLLRGTMAAFSAAIGGADTIAVLPFTAALGLPDAFARRLARNAQLILAEEANLWRVADPVAGSGAFDALTDELCRKAWTLFQDIEREGGIAASLLGGGLQARIAEVRSARERAVASRRDPITGTSEFPQLDEAAVAVLKPHNAPHAEVLTEGQPQSTRGLRASFEAPLRGAPQDEEVGNLGLGSPDTAPENTVRIDPLPSVRAAEPYETLRDRSDAILTETGRRPRVLLANLGPLAAYAARNMFARNAFAAGGIEAADAEGSPEEIAAALVQAGASIACLCSSDAVYAERAVPAADALRRAGAGRVLLAGRPGEREPALRDAGVTDFLFAGCDLLAVLRRLSLAADLEGSHDLDP